MILAMGLWVRELYLHLREVDKGAGLGCWSSVVLRDGTGAAVQEPASDKPHREECLERTCFQGREAQSAVGLDLISNFSLLWAKSLGCTTELLNELGYRMYQLGFYHASLLLSF